jgi:hypothetical protein
MLLPYCAVFVLGCHQENEAEVLQLGGVHGTQRGQQQHMTSMGTEVVWQGAWRDRFSHSDTSSSAGCSWHHQQHHIC